jgi:hypothetical protein
MKLSLTRRSLLIGLAASAALLAAPAARAELPPGAPPPESPEFPRWVMEHVDDLYRGDQSHGIFEMQVKTKHWTRTMALETWSRGTEYSLVRILAPKKERGNATLKSGNDLFTYLSKTGRTTKITGGMMGASWMGSHFTNDDLVKESRFSEDYSIKTSFVGDADGVAVYRFTLTPKPSAPVVWGKIEVTVRQDDLQPVRQDFYDEDGKRVRELAFSNYRTVSGRTMPTLMTMRPLDGSGEYTRITWKKIDFSVELDRSFFSVQRLRSM